ncbi:MAG: peptidoglycan-binding protein [Oscillatoriales cyanobacterium SM2_2_1]|nr:peptidoglycan-binding protein [Oscillatoriales cyanobacterium SM2_2_1]
MELVTFLYGELTYARHQAGGESSGQLDFEPREQSAHAPLGLLIRTGQRMVPVVVLASSLALPCWAAIAPTVSTNTFYVQHLLRENGFHPGDIDGVAGQRTREAILAAQKFYGLEPDGVVGPATLTALESRAAAVIQEDVSVQQLQRLLQQRGFYRGTIDGVIGPETRGAIMAAQRHYGLETDGIAGTKTLEALQQDRSPAVTAPSPTGDANVLRHQTLLKNRGLYLGPLDGLLGPQTKSAILAFQKANGLEPDGIVGAATLAALQQEPSASASTPDRNTIANLQNLLRDRKFYQGDITGILGAKTIAAIRAAEAQYGLASTGQPSAALTAALETGAPPKLRPPTQSSPPTQITELQQLLKQRGFYVGQVDGRSSAELTSAILRAQNFYKVLPANGQPTPDLIARLKQDPFQPENDAQ